MNRTLPLLTAGLGLAITLAFPLAAHAQPSAATSSGPAQQAATPPEQELSARILYTFLLAEIAGARGELGISLQAYMDLAQRTQDPRIARRATEIALFARNTQAASEAARIWAKTDPSSEEAKRVLAGVLAGGDGQLEQVQGQLARLLASAPEQIENHLLGLNRAFTRVADKQAVRTVINNLTEPYLNHPEAHFARAQAAITADDAIDALAEIDNALQLRADWEPATLFKSQLLSQSGADAESLKLLEDYLGRKPDSRNARLSYARALVSAKQFDPARREFRSLLEAAPEDRDLMYAVGLLSAQLDDFDTATPLLAGALKAQHPESNSIRLNLGQIADRNGRPDEAIKWYGDVEQGQHYVDAQFRIANILAQQGKMDAARKHLQALQTTESTRSRLILAEAQMLRNAGQTQEAYSVIDNGLRDDPDNADMLYESAMLAERLGKLQVMEGRLRKLIALDPDHAHAHNALGYSFADRGVNLEEAEALIIRALELTPNDPFILDSLGWVRFRRGDSAEALTHLERAYGLRPDPEIAAHIGEVLWTLDRRQDASRIWSEALEAHPENSALKEAMQRLKAK